MFGLFKKNAAADIVFTGGTIYTQNPEAPLAEAVACKDGRIMAVGDVELIGQFQSKTTEVVDLAGAFLLPGFIDAGGHPTLRVFQEVCLVLNDDMPLEEVEAALRRHVADNPEKRSYFAYGFNFELVEALGREEARARLDAICGDKPVAVLDSGGMQGWFNNRAIREVKEAIEAEKAADDDDDEEKPLPPLTIPLILSVLSPFDFDKLREAILLLAAEYCAKGYTTVFDCGSPDYFQSMYQEILIEILQEDFLKQRFMGSMLVTKNLDSRYVVGRLMQKKTNCMEVDTFITFNTLKLVIDPEAVHKNGLSPDELGALAKAAAERGFDVHIDAVCRKGLAAAYAAVALSRAAGYNSSRFTIARSLPAEDLSPEDSEEAPDRDPALFEAASTLGDFREAFRDAADAESVSEALDRLTLDAAERLGAGHLIGSVTTNKKADFAIFKEDPLACDWIGFRNLSAWMTVLDGKIVYNAEEDDPAEWVSQISFQDFDRVEDFDEL